MVDSVVRIDRYVIDRHLGTGGMGEVYLAYSPAGDPVAIKQIRSDRLDPLTRTRFETEAEIARTVIGTSRVARFLDADPYAERPWLAVEYVPGITLAAHVEDHGPLAEPLVASLGALLAEGLTAVHAAGLLHRDVKPQNVMLGRYGPVLIDFGLGAFLDDGARPGEAGIVAGVVEARPELGRRAEFLWGLVGRRMEISEDAIARRIPVWGADPTTVEFAFLDRGGAAVEKEQVFEDLFEAPDTPYWRLKQVMDAWCALWFWPLGHASSLDGSAGVYAAAKTPPAPPAPEPARATTAPLVYDSPALFGVDGEQLGLDGLEPTAPMKVKGSGSGGHKPRPRQGRRPMIPLADLDDWLDFLEAMLGTDDVPEGSLVSQFDTLDELRIYEDQLPAWMGMDVGDPEQRFPWLHQVREIADQQGILHWPLEFARVFQSAAGGFDLQVGNPPWVRPDWNEAAVLVSRNGTRLATRAMQ